MIEQDFVAGVLHTEADISLVPPRLSEPLLRMWHGASIVSTEGGELLDQLRKHTFYGKPLDTGNLIEEMGDVCYGLGLLCDALGVTFEHLWQTNHAKLSARYKDKFTLEEATNRNLQAEREAIDGSAS